MWGALSGFFPTFGPTVLASRVEQSKSNAGGVKLVGVYRCDPSFLSIPERQSHPFQLTVNLNL